MTDERDPYEEWDAAYVLGGLTPAERREFEAHLRTCGRCAGAVAELAGIPALLGRVPAEEAFALLGDGPPAAAPVPDLLSGLLAAVRRRRRRLVLAGIGTLAAAAVAAGIVALPGVLLSSSPPVSVNLEAGSSSPLSANVQLMAESWGTRVDMSCRYEGAPAPAGTGRWRYALAVTDRTGHETIVSSWAAGPGDTVHTTGTVDLAAGEIASIAVKSAKTGGVLLRADLPPPS